MRYKSKYVEKTYSIAYNIIDIDERGEFRAHIEDRNGNTIFEYDDQIFEDGFMKHKKDMNGLLHYLKTKGISISRLQDNG